MRRGICGLAKKMAWRDEICELQKITRLASLRGVSAAVKKCSYLNINQYQCQWQ
jgi:hypothetical protein